MLGWGDGGHWPGAYSLAVKNTWQYFSLNILNEMTRCTSIACVCVAGNVVVEVLSAHL